MSIIFNDFLDFHIITQKYIYEIVEIKQRRIFMFWEIFNRLCNDHNIKPNAVAKELAIPSGSVTDWKKGRIPRDGTLIKIADYFNVSTNYLLGKADQKEKPTETDGLEEGTILLALRDGGVKKRKLTSEQMELIEKMIEQMPEANEDL